MTWDEVERSEGNRGHLEYWSAETATAWILREGDTAHESPPGLLSELLTRIALERGSRIRCYGSVYLMERDGESRPRKVATADQTVYLRPEVWLPRDPAVIQGEDPLPEVILEVDHTIDARTAERVVEVLTGIDDRDRLAEAGDLIIECDDGADLLSRLS